MMFFPSAAVAQSLQLSCTIFPFHSGQCFNVWGSSDAANFPLGWKKVLCERKGAETLVILSQVECCQGKKVCLVRNCIFLLGQLSVKRDNFLLRRGKFFVIFRWFHNRNQCLSQEQHLGCFPLVLMVVCIVCSEPKQPYGSKQMRWLMNTNVNQKGGGWTTVLWPSAWDVLLTSPCSSERWAAVMTPLGNLHGAPLQCYIRYSIYSIAYAI